MTDPDVRIDPVRLSAQPGTQAQVVVTVTNPGSIVEGFRLDVLGEGVPAWTTVSPPELSVYPHQEAQATLTISVPAHGVSSRVIPFAVRATSLVDPNARAVAEGDFEVGRVFGLSATIAPVNSAGRRSGQHVLTVTNHGNTPAQLVLAVSDPDQKLRFTFQPPTLLVGPGSAARSRLKVAPRQSMITGTAVRLPFRVAAQSYPPTPGGLPAADPRRPVVDAAFIQQPILPRGLIAALTLALTLGAVGVAYAVKQAQRVPTAAPTASPLPGAPPAPSLTATKVDSHTIRLDWQSSDTPESYLLSHIEAATQETVAGNFSSKPVDGLQPGQSYCFQLQAVKAGLKSALSNKACATTDPLPASATPAGTTTSVQGIVPDVAQQTYEVAKSTLEQAGYQVRMFLEQSTTTGPGLVIRTYPAANVRLPPGSEVRVYVAS